MLEDVRNRASVNLMAARFHNALVGAVVELARVVAQPCVVLSGGCFQNKYLTERMVQQLRSGGFRAYWHRKVPPNDGGIALGQVVAALRNHEQD
jgi:hydrogenase maturation protein HypF